MDEYRNKYPFNALHDMGLSDEVIDRNFWDIRCRFYELIRSGLLTSTRYRVFTRHYIDGDSIQDVSQDMGCSENHIKRELSKIRHILRKNRLKIMPECLEQDEDSEWLIDEDQEEWEDDPDFSVIRPYENPYFVDIADLGLSVRAYNCLRRAGIETAGDIQAMGIHDLKNVRNLGRRSLEEVLSVLKKRFDFSLEEEEIP